MKKKLFIGWLLIFSLSCVPMTFAQSNDQAASKRQDIQRSVPPSQRQMKKVKPALGRPRIVNVDVGWSERRAFEKQSGLSWQNAPLKVKQKFIRRYRKAEEKQIWSKKRQLQRELKNKNRIVRQIHKKHARMRRDKDKKEKVDVKNFTKYKKQAQKNMARLQRQGKRSRRVR